MSAQLPIVRGDWQENAACQTHDPDLFFGPDDEKEPKKDRCEREKAAKLICAGCKVRELCLEQALVSGERYGIWGGLTYDERVRRSLTRRCVTCRRTKYKNFFPGRSLECTACVERAERHGR